MATESTESVTSRVMARNMLRSIRQQRYLGIALVAAICILGVNLGITWHNRGSTDTLKSQVRTLQGQNHELTKENGELRKEVSLLTPLINSDIGEVLKNRSFGNDSRRVTCEVLQAVAPSTWQNNTDCQKLSKQQQNAG